MWAPLHRFGDPVRAVKLIGMKVAFGSRDGRGDAEAWRGASQDAGRDDDDPVLRPGDGQADALQVDARDAEVRVLRMDHAERRTFVRHLDFMR